VEKKRHLRLVDTKVFHLLKRVHVLSHMNKISSTSEISSENYSVDLWIDVSRLRIALRAWQQELTKIDEHIAMLEQDVLARPTIDDAVSSSGSNTDGSTTATLGPNIWRESAIVAGRRMQKRLREIKTEYDLKIQECTMVLDGMALSTQLVRKQHVLNLPSPVRILDADKKPPRGTCAVSLGVRSVTKTRRRTSRSPKTPDKTRARCDPLRF